MKCVSITLLLSVLLLAGCDPSGPNVRPDPEPRNPSTLSERGQHRQAAERWLELAREWDASQPARAAQARLSAIEAFLQSGQLERARSVMTELEVNRLSA
ncbi:MAG: hypothetical protein AAF446_10940 [Pseudomonadota bacterium]